MRDAERSLRRVHARLDIGEPLRYCGWRPHPTFAMMDLAFLEDPQYIFGINYIGVCVNGTLKNTVPDLYHCWENQVVPLSEVEAMIRGNDLTVPPRRDILCRSDASKPPGRVF